jgi:UDP-2,3-diacylglucosamine pyrophosphatase LpxH
MSAAEETTPKRYRTLFISDVHLGTRTSRAELLLDFLREHDADTIYLVGDIVDFWRLKRSAHWPQSHNDVVQKMLRKVRKGARIYYIPGNHDEDLRAYCGSHFGGIEVIDRIVHTAADGRRYLVIHGDQFDVVTRHAKWLAYLGDWAYVFAMWVSSRVSLVRRRAGLPYWSLSAFLKQKVKQAVSYIGAYETALVNAAREAGASGVICGHIHHAAMREVGDILYVNLGDWVESGTAVVELEDGRMEIIGWLDHVEQQRLRERREARLAAAA